MSRKPRGRMVGTLEKRLRDQRELELQALERQIHREQRKRKLAAQDDEAAPAPADDLVEQLNMLAMAGAPKPRTGNGRTRSREHCGAR